MVPERTLREQQRQECHPVMAAALVFISLKPKLTRIDEAVNYYLCHGRPFKVPFYDYWAFRQPYQRKKI